MKALAHTPVEQHVGNGDDRHALVVRHECSHHGEARAFGKAATGIVQRLVHAVTAARAE